jgi:hypothetical protein
MLELSEQPWSECKGELVDCDDNAVDARTRPFLPFPPEY